MFALVTKKCKFDCYSLSFTSKGVRPSPLATSLPKMVPHFTGRRSECDEIMGHLTSDTTQLVTIWGSPGFGKTSVAIAVGHDLRNKGMPVCWLSLRGLRSKAALTSKILGCIRPSVINEQPSFLRLSLDDQLCQLLSEISDHLFSFSIMLTICWKVVTQK